jgi:hypothetical protein
LVVEKEVSRYRIGERVLGIVREVENAEVQLGREMRRVIDLESRGSQLESIEE